MEKYTRAFERFEKAYRKFKEIIENPLFPEIFKEEFVVEITTKRFEYTYESMWKTVKEFLRLRGIECNSPKSCFRELLKEGIISEEFEGILSDIIVLRNTLVHVYDEKQAKDIYQKLRTKEILKTFEALIRSLEKEKP
ncbi:DUF86 domain-containing protein [Persephonella sp.]